MDMYLNDKPVTLDGLFNESELGDAVYRSLFSWARAQVDDEVDGHDLYGWWGDCLADTSGDRFGSRLWRFMRVKMSDVVPGQIKQMAEEALDWLINDGIADAVDVTATRIDKERCDLEIVVKRSQGQTLNLRFEDLWNGI